MSLINDALRRAKQAQQETAPADPAVTQFRPVEPAAQPARHSVGVLLPVALGLVALLALLLIWELSRRGSPAAPAANSPLNVSARVLPAEPPASGQVETPRLQSGPADPASSGAARPAANNASASPTTSDRNPATAPLSGSVPSKNAAASLDASDTNTAAPPPEAAPAPLKLQSIVFNPRNPSALINGRVVFLGDRIRDLNISAIHRDSVVLTGPGRTNVLNLEP